MSGSELRGLKVGDRVKLSQLGGTAFGTVARKFRGCIWVEWDDGGGKWVLNPRARFDRERALGLSLIPQKPDAAG